VSNPVQGKGSDVLDSQDQVRFEMLVLPHLDAAGEDRARIHDEAIDAVALFRDNEGNVERWALLVINLLIVGDGAGAVGVELLRSRDRLGVRWPTTNHQTLTGTHNFRVRPT
jgi:hypothetical protein